MRIYMAGPLFTPYERQFIAENAARLRAAGFECFVPHEQELNLQTVSARGIFDLDMTGLGPADAVVALLDGPMIDDGTACEIGLFYGLMQHDKSKKGILGILTDSRASHFQKGPYGSGLNLFVLGCIEAVGQVRSSVDECLPILQRWAQETGAAD